MDDAEGHHRKQHALPGYAGGIPSLASPSHGDGAHRPTGAAARSGLDRPRQQMPMLGQGSSSPTPTSVQAGSASGYGFYDEAPPPGSVPVPQGAMQYHHSDYSPDHQRPPALPPQYGSGMVYGIAQQLSQNPPYDPVLPFQPSRRPAAGLDVLPPGFAGVSPPFYVPSEQLTSAATVTSQHAPSPFPSVGFTQQTPAGGRSSLAPSLYSPAMTDLPPPLPLQQPSSSAPAQHSQHPHQSAHQHAINATDMGQGTSASSSAYDPGYNWYQNSLKRTFEQIHGGQLAEAAQTLLEMSDWLLGHAVELGLARDNQDLHAERLKLWNEFNVCWLSILQKQKEMSQDMLRGGQRPTPPQTLIPENFLEKMGDDLVSLGNKIEHHGLVDYEMGVWEDQIIAVLEDCMSLVESENDASGSGSQAGQGHPASQNASVNLSNVA